MPIDFLVFDLDGTLIDSKLDLALAVNAVRERAGMDPLDHERIYSYVGDGAPTLIRRALGAQTSEEQAAAGLEFFYAHYREHMLDNTRLYPGVREALDQFLAAGKQLAVLTNKPVNFSRAILEGLGLGGHFRRVYGGNSFETKKPDPLGMNFLLEELGMARDQTMMVGDSAVDVQTARNADVLCCGVTYGLQPETFQQHPPDIVVDRIEDLAGILDGAHPRLPPNIISGTSAR